MNYSTALPKFIEELISFKSSVQTCILHKWKNYKYGGEVTDTE